MTRISPLARAPETPASVVGKDLASLTGGARCGQAAHYSTWVALLLSICLGAGCASRKALRAEAGARAPVRDRSAAPDGSRCEHEARSDREVTESAGIGSLTSSIRRVYRVFGEGEYRRRVLVCREVDTNLDGIKDVFRAYDDRGAATEERADANYDGVIDTWVRYDKGRVVQVDLDEAWDGQPDEKRFYASGKLTRIERDTNEDGNTDVWEVYVGGRLDRMGQDLNYDGRVDRWSRDSIAGSEVERAAIADTAAPSSKDDTHDQD